VYSQYGVSAFGEQVGGEQPADLLRRGGRSGARQPDGCRAVQRVDRTAQIYFRTVVALGDLG
jgi:hypothetical protein